MPIHIDENISISIGKEAEAIFNSQNDKGFLENDGVIKISQERWKIAQVCESKHWMVNGMHCDDDRNFEHAQMFNNYESIKDITFKRAIELGCGPFTNIRIIGDVANINKCILLDPLIETYLGHENCRYKDGVIVTANNKRIPIEKMLAIPGEQLANLECDLVVCINVLEHCYDAELFFNNIWDMCPPGGYIIFHDKLFSYEQAKRSVDEVYDAAHPLRIGKDLTMRFLNKFTVITNKSISVYNGLIDANQDYLYFIGKKP